MTTRRGFLAALASLVPARWLRKKPTLEIRDEWSLPDAKKFYTRQQQVVWGRKFVLKLGVTVKDPEGIVGYIKGWPKDSPQPEVAENGKSGNEKNNQVSGC